MGRIAYTITSGQLPITVNLKRDDIVIDTNVHAAYGSYSFENIDVGDGEYVTFVLDFYELSTILCATETINICTDCPEGYIAIGNNCIKYTEVTPTYTTPTYTIVKKTADPAYTVEGAIIFSSWNYNGTGTYISIPDSNHYWVNQPYPSYIGVMNRSAVWASTTHGNQDIGFSFCIDIAVEKMYYVGFGCDNYGKVKLNGVMILEQDRPALQAMLSMDNTVTHKFWFIYPINFPAGRNVIEVFGHNVESVAGVGIQIYNATEADLLNATIEDPLTSEIIFSSETLVGEALNYEYSDANGYHGYSCPDGYALDTCDGTPTCVESILLDCGEEPPTTTTSTTIYSTSTTTTTIIDYELIACIDDCLIDEYVLDTVPAYYGFFGQQAITEDSDYIFFAFADTYEVEYKHTVMYRYNKSTQVFNYVRITTPSAFVEYHKVPTVFVTSTGALLMAIEQLPGSNNHNGPVLIYRWVDPSDLNTYTYTTIGDSSTVRLAYPEMQEINGNIIVEARGYMSKRILHKSSDDGVSFGIANNYLTFTDTDYWAYALFVCNTPKNSQTIIAIEPLNNDNLTNAFQYISFVRTDFTNFYSLDGTSLGASLTPAELEGIASIGDIVKNNNSYFSNCHRIAGDYIYSVVYEGLGPYTSNQPILRVYKTHLTTGVVTVGTPISNPFGGRARSMLIALCDKMYIRSVPEGGGAVHYHEISEDLSSLTLVHTVSGNWGFMPIRDKYTELSALLDKDLNKIFIYRGENPNLVFDYTTTTSTTNNYTTTTSTTIFQEVTLKTDLISVWEFDETSGTTANDSHGTNNLSNSNATVNSTGLLDKSYLYNGTTSRLTLASAAEFAGLGSVSISAWVYSSFNVITDEYRIIVSKLHSSWASPYYQFMLRTRYWSKKNYEMFFGSGSEVGYAISGDSALLLNQWVHLVGIYDGTSGSGKIYINGVDSTVATLNVSPASLGSATSSLTIGDDVGAVASFKVWNGSIDQVAIWNRVLSPTEITELYNSGNGLAYIDWITTTTTTTIP